MPVLTLKGESTFSEIEMWTVFHFTDGEEYDLEKDYQKICIGTARELKTVNNKYCGTNNQISVPPKATVHILLTKTGMIS